MWRDWNNTQLFCDLNTARVPLFSFDWKIFFVFNDAFQLHWFYRVQQSERMILNSELIGVSPRIISEDLWWSKWGWERFALRVATLRYSVAVVILPVASYWSANFATVWDRPRTSQRLITVLDLALRRNVDKTTQMVSLLVFSDPLVYNWTQS
jgi:hypothetical protein